MEIALNVESKRKTATAVAFRDGSRSFGEEALNIGVKFPAFCYKYFLDLVAKPLDHPLVQAYQKKYPFYQLESDARGTVVFRHNETTTYSPEELIGMLISHATFIAERYSGQKVKDAVVTVPAFFSQAERRAVMDAAGMAGINILQLMNEHMAVALNYGMFRRKELNSTAKNIMFYNQGASGSWASVVTFQIVKTKERGFSETHPQAQVIGFGYDRTLGGVELQLKIQDMIADKFSKVKKTKRDPRDVPRAMGKIFKEAGKVKLVLSANKEYTAQIENVLDDEDLRIPFTREEFEVANAGFFERVLHPIKMALKTADITMKSIDQVILFGGSTRVPMVQQKLLEFLEDRELGKSLNTDEAAAMGAVYKAADLSSGFKVKKFITREAVIFPIDVDFKRDLVDEDGSSGGVKMVKRTLFGLMNNYPQKKIMTFNKFTDDFEFSVNINNIDYLPENERAHLIGLNLTKNFVKGVKGAFEKNAGENIDPKGVKAHFNMDDSGLLNLEITEAVFEKNFTVEMQIQAEKDKVKTDEADVKAKEAEETWAKLGDKISSFWGGNEDGKEEGKEDDKKEEKKDDKKDEKKKDEKKKDDKKKKEAPKKPIISTIKEPLEASVELVDLKELEVEVKGEYAAKLQAWTDHDKAIAMRATAFNDLESFAIDMQAKLYEEVYEKCSTEEEREKILKKCSEISDWLYDEYTDETELKVLQSKLKEVKDLTAGLKSRVREQTDRPEAMEALKNMLNTSNHFYNKAVNSTSVVDGFFTQDELDALGKLLETTKKWIEDAEKTVAEQPMHEMPKITAGKVAEKGISLDKEVKYLVNKAKIAKREAAEKAAKEAAEKAKKEEAEKKKKDKAAAANETAEESSGDAPEGKIIFGVCFLKKFRFRAQNAKCCRSH